MLTRLGFRRVRQRGSHVRYRGVFNGQERNVTLVANQRQIPAKTLRAIAAQIGVAADQLEEMLTGK